MVRLRFLNEFQFQMLTTRTDFAAVSVIIHIPGKENRRTVARTERLELLEHPEELRGYLREVNFRIHIDYRRHHLLGDVAAYVSVYP